ncbi:hypothetical protein ADK67_09065 [Saccharothrix sp. NRRL B-16348]|uniref:hypothetical protein n=1 Tax=Saccharothrix sp. NRRL B-16348 TaxID=1415542 RepID=UPI0006AF57BC|nr:hypothetical protein [Saccharothrix sp. NRRL B-16348]KOX31028.1 hypothetical protein ADK67_09065 [Saccharothrix sp. NRRL B-16348]
MTRGDDVVEPRDEALHARIQQLEGRVEQLTGLLAELTSDRDRPPHEPRFPAALDTVYQAKTFGYVSVYFTTGRTARVRLLVGPQSPPTTVVAHIHDGFLGGVVRPGEFWLAATHKPGLRTGYECVFTPLF